MPWLDRKAAELSRKASPDRTRESLVFKRHVPIGSLDKEPLAGVRAPCSGKELSKSLPFLGHSYRRLPLDEIQAAGKQLIIPHPLPEVPIPRSAPRRSSESIAPSIAPSLLPYIERDSAEIEGVEFGMATRIAIQCDSILTAGEEKDLPLEVPEETKRISSWRKQLAFSPKSWPLGQLPQSGETTFSYVPSNQSLRHSSLIRGGYDIHIKSLWPSNKLKTSQAAVDEERMMLSESEWMRGSPLSLR